MKLEIKTKLNDEDKGMIATLLIGVAAMILKKEDMETKQRFRLARFFAETSALIAKCAKGPKAEKAGRVVEVMLQVLDTIRMIEEGEGEENGRGTGGGDS